MERTDNFFIIHNYNTVPEDLLKYCKDYIIYDASDDGVTRGRLDELGIKYIPIENTGHNLTTYFRYFYDNYDNLPEVMVLLKGNILGRHCTEEYFSKVYNNHRFTYLYEDKPSRCRYEKTKAGQKPGVAFLAWDNVYLEKNSSWYVNSPNHPHRYFRDIDDMIRFIYKDPVIPEYLQFAPGGCYIVLREQVLKHSKEFYRNLNKLMDYGMDPSFPSEAHQIERLFPIIFEAVYDENEWMNDEEKYDSKLIECMDNVRKQDEWYSQRFKKIKTILGLKPDFNS